MSDDQVWEPVLNNYAAIATVTAVLRDYLQPVVDKAISGATVATGRPEAANDGGQHKPVVNIFLYMVSPNPAWRNTELEIRYPGTKDPETKKEFRPKQFQKKTLLPLDLSYLFSFYGNDKKLEPQQLLGRVMSSLHAHPRLLPEDIDSAMKSDPGLQGSGLLNQVKYVEHITLTPVSLNLEELSKIWSVFFQVPYALSVAYMASTLLIEPGPAQEPRKVVKRVKVKPARPKVPS